MIGEKQCHAVNKCILFEITRMQSVMHQSLPAAPSRAPFALDGKFPGVGTLGLSKPPGWGQKKRANAPSSVNHTATFFIDRTVM